MAGPTFVNNSEDMHIKELHSWYEHYIDQFDPSLFCKPLANEPLNLEDIQRKIEQMVPLIEVNSIDGFCLVCQAMFETWPANLGARRQKYRNTTEKDTETKEDIETPLEFKAYPAWKWVKGWGDVITLNSRTTTISLEAAAKAGCRCCALFLQSIVGSDLLHVFRAIESRLQILGKPSRISINVFGWWPEENAAYVLEVSFPAHFKKPSTMYLGLNKYPLRLIGHRLDTSSHGDHPPKNTGFPMSMDRVLTQIREWSSTCLSSHEACNEDHFTEYPTRLLSIAEKPIRIVETSSLRQKPPYATLSYCWGKVSNHTCLTSGNIDSFMVAVPAEALPKTFIEAITIAQTAEIEYLWIDSLCIIQGDALDWSHEAGKMAFVYGGSALNIAASSAKNPAEGCFMRRAHSCSGFYSTLTVDNQRVDYEFRASGNYTHHVTGSFLASRAWAVQEKILSPRTLHCGVWGYFWECRNSICSEFFPNGFRTYLNPPPLVLRPQTWHTVESRWKELIEWYSACDLTIETDKLVAFSGIARALSKEKEDEYVAGLLRSTIEDGLCWSVSMPILTSTKRPSSYRAPSWSWAAVNSKVMFRYVPTHWREYAKTRSISIVTPTDPFGTVIEGSITLKCPGLVAGELVILGLEHHPLPPNFYAKIGSSKQYFPISVDCWDIDQDTGLQGETVYFLAIKGTSDEHPDWYFNFEGTRYKQKAITGLVLRLTNKQKVEFCRIGSFTFSDADQCDAHDYELFVKKLQSFGKGIAQGLGCEVNELEDEKHKVLICII